MNLRWTQSALADLDDAHAYISAENRYAARDIITRIEQALAALMAHPHIGRAGRCQDTRELVISGTPFVVAYRAKKNAIEILAVIHHARTWPEEL
jgi:toxin ParE1/3/4